jgi:phosphoribosylamine--glycine ligase
MKVLVIGGGGREHALAWKLSRSPKVTKVYTAPGNPGTALVGENVLIPAENIAELKEFAISEGIDLTVVGPELPLTLGIADEFAAAGLKVFGPSEKAAEIEGSKIFCKELMQKYRIPTGYFKKFDNPEFARAYIETHEPPFVVKADGLAAGKGVIICHTKEEAAQAVGLIMDSMAFGEAGSNIIIEEFLTGEEASLLAITDG